MTAPTSLLGTTLAAASAREGRSLRRSDRQTAEDVAAETFTAALATPGCHADAARVAGITRLAFAARLSRARRRLKNALDGFEHRPVLDPRPQEIHS